MIFIFLILFIFICFFIGINELKGKNIFNLSDLIIDENYKKLVNGKLVKF
jgi:hypothetical protein